MDVNKFTESQFRNYYEARIGAKALRKAGAGFVCKCVFHDDKTPSMSLNFEKGVWHCHTGCGSGGIIDFEKKFSGCDLQQALRNIADIVGVPQPVLGVPKWEALYDYVDEFGKLIYQVVRYPKDPTTGKKQIKHRRPLEAGGWEWNADKCRKVLYRLPEVIIAREVLVFEGEKKCDLVRKDFDVVEGVAATCNSGGAGKWLDSFSPYVAGKKVIIFQDNDDAGRKHALSVAHSVFRYAVGVKIVTLPNLPEKGDVVDYYAAGHGLADLIGEANKTPWWRPPEVENSIFVDVVEFTQNAPKEIDWTVEGVIQRGANGIISARPKAGKSFVMVDLCLALAAGQLWLPGKGSGFYIDKPVRTGLVSREDHPGLTQWRIMKIAQGRRLQLEEIRQYLYINSRQQKSRLMLDDEADVAELLRALEKNKTEFLILDVLRRLHDKEENDNTEMQQVLDVIIGIQNRIGCQIAIVHHDNKREDATLTERLRGATALAGYAEWVMGLKVVNPEEPKHLWVREFEVEIKAALPPDNFHVRYIDQPDGGITVESVHWEPPRRGRKKADQDQQRLPGTQESDSDKDGVPF